MGNRGRNSGSRPAGAPAQVAVRSDGPAHVEVRLKVGGVDVGGIEAYQDGPKHMKVFTATVPLAANQGKGYGTRLYSEAQKQAAARGLTLRSSDARGAPGSKGDQLSAAARATWEGFVKRGQAKKVSRGNVFHYEML